MQRAATKQAMAQKLIEQRFPGGIASITTSTTIKPDKPKGSGGGSGNKGTEEKADYSAWIKENLRKKKKVDVISGVTANRATGAGGSGGKVETKELDRPELETPEMFKVFYDKLVTVNPRYAYGSQVGQTGENANKVFKRVGNTIIPFSVTEEQIMNDEYLNNLLVSESILW